MESADDARARFDRDGYWIAPPLFDPAVIEKAREHAALVIAGDYDTGVAPQIVYEASDPVAGLRKIDNAWWADSVLEQIVTSPEIGRTAADLMGVDEVYLWHDQLLWKPPQSGDDGNVGWHQDRGYWTASTSSNMCTAWVALGDVSEHMGAMRFVPESNHWGRVIEGFDAFFQRDHDAQRAAAVLPDGAEWREVAVELPAGAASFHHCKTLHGSGPNLSDEPRVSIAVHLMAGDARIRRDRDHPNLELTDAHDGSPWRGPRFPRLWPPPGDDLG